MDTIHLAWWADRMRRSANHLAEQAEQEKQRELTQALDAVTSAARRVQSLAEVCNNG